MKKYFVISSQKRTMSLLLLLLASLLIGSSLVGVKMANAQTRDLAPWTLYDITRSMRQVVQHSSLPGHALVGETL